MANMILEVYDAFKSIGIDDETARKAAGALSDNPSAIADLRSDMKDEFVLVRSEMADLRSNMKDEFAKVRSEVAERFNLLRSEQMVHRTMLGILIAGVVSIVLKLYV